MRESLARGMASGRPRALTRLGADLEAIAARPVRVELGPPWAVTVGGRPAHGPWLSYLPRPDGTGGWLGLGWSPADEAAAVGASLGLELDDRFRLGPIAVAGGGRPAEPFCAVLLSVEYEAGSLPAEHRLVNDLHAMVMLHDLLAESVGRI